MNSFDGYREWEARISEQLKVTARFHYQLMSSDTNNRKRGQGGSGEGKGRIQQKFIGNLLCTIRFQSLN